MNRHKTELSSTVRALLEAPGQVNDGDRFCRALDLCVAKVLWTVMGEYTDLVGLLDFVRKCEQHETSASDLNASTFNIIASDLDRYEAMEVEAEKIFRAGKSIRELEI